MTNPIIVDPNGPNTPFIDLVSSLVRSCHLMHADKTTMEFTCEGQRYKVLVKRTPAASESDGE